MGDPRKAQDRHFYFNTAPLPVYRLESSRLGKFEVEARKPVVKAWALDLKACYPRGIDNFSSAHLREPFTIGKPLSRQAEI